MVDQSSEPVPCRQAPRTVTSSVLRWPRQAPAGGWPRGPRRTHHGTVSKRPSGHLWLVPGAAVLATSVALLYRFTAEDAYIVARYAENLVQHGVLHFNVGEPVNALTSPLHALVEAALYGLTGATLGTYKVLGVGCLLATAWRVVGSLRADPVAQGAALLVAVAPCTVLWSVGGLETPLLMWLVTTLVAMALAPHPSRADVVAASAVAALCVLTRYDAVLLAGPAVIGVWLRRGSLADAARGAAVGATLVGAWLGWAWFCYGDVLPTSFYVKTPGTDHLLDNAIYVGQYLVLTGVAPLAVWAVWRRRSGRAPEATGLPWPVWTGLALVGLYALTAATTHMMFGFRLVVPYVPALALGLGHAVGRSAPFRHRRMARVVLVAAAVVQVGQAVWFAQISVNGPVWSRATGNAVASAERRAGEAYEYRRLSAEAYAGPFLSGLSRAADAIRTDWAETGTARAPRLFTYAAGRLPYELPGAYVFEVLVSHRRGCTYPYDLALSADYIHLLAPGHGAFERQVPLAGTWRYRLVHHEALAFNGTQQHVLVLRNETPRSNPLPARLHDACAPSADWTSPVAATERWTNGGRAGAGR